MIADLSIRPGEAPSLKDAHAKYLEHIQTNRSRSTYITYKASLHRFMDFVGDETVTRQKVDEYVQHLKENYHQGTGAKHRRVLRSFFLFCVAKGWMEMSPLNNSNSLNEPVRPAKTLVTHEEWRKMVDASEGTHVQFLVRALWMTGLSISDCATLEWKHIQLEPPIITKVRKKTRAYNRPCSIPVIPGGELHRLLRKAWLNRMHAANIWPNDKDHHYVDPWLASYITTGQETRVYREWATVLELAGVRPEIRPHDFRRATFSHLAGRLDMLQIMQLTGTSTVSVVKRYCTPDVARLASAFHGVEA